MMCKSFKAGLYQVQACAQLPYSSKAQYLGPYPTLSNKLLTLHYQIDPLWF
jgi:hypothetical protein